MAKLSEKIVRIAFGDIAGRGLGFLTTIYLARTLGAEGFGLITIALSFLGYTIWFSDLGLLNIGAREMAKEPLKRIFRAKEVFILKIILGILILAGCLIVIPLLQIDPKLKQIILGFSYSLIPYAFLMEWYYNGRQHFGKVALSKISNSLVYLILVYFLIKSNNDIELIPFLYTAGISTSALVLGTYSFRDNIFELPSRGWNLFKDLLKSASTLGLGWFFLQVIQLLPPLAIGFFLSAQDAGIYSAAIRIIFIAMLADRIFVNLLLPNLSFQWTENKTAAIANLDIVSRLTLLFGSSLALFVAISASDIILFIYGSEYAGSIQPLVMLTILLFATFPNSLFSFGLVAMGKDSEFLKSTIVSGFISFAAILTSAYYFELVTVSLIISLCEVMIALISFYWFSRFVKIRFMAPAIVTALIGTGIYYVSTLVDFMPLLEGMIGALILVPLLYLTRVYSIEHITWFKERLL